MAKSSLYIDVIGYKWVLSEFMALHQRRGFQNKLMTQIDAINQMNRPALSEINGTQVQVL